MKYLPIDKALFIENRKRFRASLKPNALAIFNSNDEMPRSADGTYPFRQNSDLFYLTGIDQEQTTLIIFPDSPVEIYKEVLFIRKTDETIAIWEGQKYTQEQAREASGIQTIIWSENWNSVFDLVMHYAQSIYLNMNEHDRFVTAVPCKDKRFALEIKEKYPLHTYERSAPIMAQLRAVKSETEIHLMQTAIDITSKAFDRVLKFVKPGCAEYEVEAEIIHEFISKRSSGHAYSPIIASGANACILHYTNNNQVCKDGDLILMDFGAEYANYAADLTRTIPVNGKFTPRQRQVYDAVLRVLKGAKALLVIGNTIEAYNKEVGKIMEKELIALGLIKQADVDKQASDSKGLPLYKKYFNHGASHFLGLDVHDIGNRYEPMKAGMVFTCEPGIYIPEENLGIRIENDILITENGPVDLTAAIPIEADEIEKIMSEIKADQILKL
jgi:Xaa-Pro aminopeptidase